MAYESRALFAVFRHLQNVVSLSQSLFVYLQHNSGFLQHSGCSDCHLKLHFNYFSGHFFSYLQCVLAGQNFSLNLCYLSRLFTLVCSRSVLHITHIQIMSKYSHDLHCACR